MTPENAPCLLVVDDDPAFASPEIDISIGGTTCTEPPSPAIDPIVVLT